MKTRSKTMTMLLLASIFTAVTAMIFIASNREWASKCRQLHRDVGWA